MRVATARSILARAYRRDALNGVDKSSVVGGFLLFIRIVVIGALVQDVEVLVQTDLDQVARFASANAKPGAQAHEPKDIPHVHPQRRKMGLPTSPPEG